MLRLETESGRKNLSLKNQFIEKTTMATKCPEIESFFHLKMQVWEILIQTTVKYLKPNVSDAENFFRRYCPLLVRHM